MDVLIVEDEETLLESLVEGLASVFPDLDVRGCGSAEDAEVLMDAAMPRLIVSDVRLPSKDGVELLLGVRERSSRIPFVFMSAYPSPEAQAQAREGGIRFLSKPFDFEELVDAVEEALGDNQFSGEVGGISLVDLLQVLNMGRRTAAVTLERRGETGRIYLRDGEVVHAEVAGFRGREAFDRLMAWKGGSFGSEPGREAPVDTIAEPFNSLLLDSFRLMDEAEDLDGQIDEAFGDDLLGDAAPGETADSADRGRAGADAHQLALRSIPGCLFSGRVDLRGPALVEFAPEEALDPPMLELVSAGAVRLLEQDALHGMDRGLSRADPAEGGLHDAFVGEAIVRSSDMIYVFQRSPDDPDHAYVNVCETSAGFGTVVAKARRWRRLSN